MAYNLLALLAIGMAVGIEYHCSGPIFQDLMNRQVRDKRRCPSLHWTVSCIWHTDVQVAYSGVWDKNMLVLLTLKHLILLTH